MFQQTQGQTIQSYQCGVYSQQPEVVEFQLANRGIVAAKINKAGEKVWIKNGSMVAYTGKIDFAIESIKDQGLLKTIKESVTGEGMQLVKATAKEPSTLFCSDAGKGIIILKLRDGESIYVRGENVLAFEHSVKWDITLMKGLTSAIHGGLFQVKLTGAGDCAITAKKPLRLDVSPNCPVFTDPDNTVFWSNGVKPSIVTDIDVLSVLGKKHGEEFQMKFEGTGFVVIQAIEESQRVVTKK